MIIPDKNNKLQAVLIPDKNNRLDLSRERRECGVRSVLGNSFSEEASSIIGTTAVGVESREGRNNL
jgi:hypothetical protein